jgi:Tfp pilus assembly PilM family ATPase
MSAWLTPTTPTVAIEIASRRVTVAELIHSTGRPAIATYASESLAAGAVTPALMGVNIPNPKIVSDALAKACERAGIGSLRRAALVVPDAVARVSLLSFDEVPARPADLHQLVTWQLRKATPFPLEEARIDHIRASGHGNGATFAAIVARTDVLAQYETVAALAGARAGIVDLASFNVMNAAMSAQETAADPSTGSGSPRVKSRGDWLLVCLAHEGTSIAILRGTELLFYRYRASMDGEPLSALVHQTAMYHEDRLGGSAFTRVFLCGAASTSGSTDSAREEIAARLKVAAEIVDVRQAADLRDRITASPDVLDALAAPVGVLMRSRPPSRDARFGETPSEPKAKAGA